VIKALSNHFPMDWKRLSPFGCAAASSHERTWPKLLTTLKKDNDCPPEAKQLALCTMCAGSRVHTFADSTLSQTQGAVLVVRCPKAALGRPAGLGCIASPCRWHNLLPEPSKIVGGALK